MGIYEELVARGLIAQVTNEEEIREMVNNGKATFYIGFDCTADSLHVGHFMALCLMKRLQMAGNKPIALIGGGTTMIGDPSGRTDMRKMLTKEDIDHNAECFRRQMSRFIEFGEGKAVFYQNGSWEFANLTGEEKGFKMNPEDLAMIPIYCGVEGEEQSGLCCGTENCWAVNKNAKEEDIQATLDFMKWVVTSEEGTTMLAEQFGPCPFKNAKTPANVFFADANAYTAAGKYIVTWAFNWTPAVDDWRAGVVDALTQYTVNGGSWDNVKTAFVDGWATQYAKENG